MSIHEHIAEEVETARIFARDGAFRTAARILRSAADDLADHADACDAAMIKLYDGGSKARFEAEQQLWHAKEGVEHLRRARASFRASANRRTLDRVRSALSSAAGAVRVAGYRKSQAEAAR